MQFSLAVRFSPTRISCRRVETRAFGTAAQHFLAVPFMAMPWNSATDPRRVKLPWIFSSADPEMAGQCGRTTSYKTLAQGCISRSALQQEAAVHYTSASGLSRNPSTRGARVSGRSMPSSTPARWLLLGDFIAKGALLSTQEEVSRPSLSRRPDIRSCPSTIAALAAQEEFGQADRCCCPTAVRSL